MPVLPRGKWVRVSGVRLLRRVGVMEFLNLAEVVAEEVVADARPQRHCRPRSEYGGGDFVGGEGRASPN